MFHEPIFTRFRATTVIYLVTSLLRTFLRIPFKFRMKSKHLNISCSWPVPLMAGSSYHPRPGKFSHQSRCPLGSSCNMPNSVCSQVFPLSSLLRGLNHSWLCYGRTSKEIYIYRDPKFWGEPRLEGCVGFEYVVKKWGEGTAGAKSRR